MVVQRRAARTLAFQALFELESRPGSDVRSVVRERAEALEDEGKTISGPSIDFAGCLVQGTLDHCDDIDQRIAVIAPAFPVQTLARVDRVVLHLATYELLVARDAPVQVVISEAVQLAKTYGGDNSGRFVNGVLGTIAEGMQENASSAQRSDTSQARPERGPSRR